MGLPAGRKKQKNSGRKKGTTNRRTRELLEILDQLGFEPLTEIIRVNREAWKEYDRCSEIHDALQENRFQLGMKSLVEETDAPKYLKLAESSAAEVMQYTFPKRKAVEHTGENGKPLEATQVVLYLPNNGRAKKD